MPISAITFATSCSTVTRRWWCSGAVLLAAALAPACGGSPSGTETGGGGSGACAAGHLAGPDGTCTPVGIQGCAAMFIEDDNLCHPSVEKCPKGTIPKFDEGCVSVGIQSCAAMFIEDDDGLCHPSMAKCASQPGTIPKFDEGCVPVGIQGCDPGFIEDDGLCHPTMANCPAGSFAVPQQGCVPIDGPDGCGSGPWGNLKDDVPKTIWVDPSAMASGDGLSKASPVKTITEALAKVAAGGRIALEAGTYDEPLHVKKSMTVEGRCSSMVKVQGVYMGAAPAIVLIDKTADVTLRGLAIGGEGEGIVALNAPELTIDHVHILNARMAGIEMLGSNTGVTISNSWIEDTLPEVDGGVDGLGLVATNGAKLTITDSCVADNRSAGIHVADGGSTALITDTLIEGTRPRESDAKNGEAIQARDAANVVLDSSAVVANHYAGLFVGGADTTVTMTKSLVQGTLPEPDLDLTGVGVVVLAEGSLTVESSALIANRVFGILVDDSGTSATITGSLIGDTLPDDATLESGHGLEVRGGAGVVLDTSAVVRSHDEGVFVAEAGSTIIATGNLIEDTLAEVSDGRFGRGLAIQSGAGGKVVGNAVIRNREVGIFLGGSDLPFEVTNNLVDQTMPQESDKCFGRGVGVEEGPQVTFDANVVAGNHDVGVFVGGAVLTGNGNLVEDTMPKECDGEYGVGIAAADSSSIHLSSSTLRNNRVAALMINASSGVISGCLVDGVPDGKFHYEDPPETHEHVGDGILVNLGSNVDISDSAVRSCVRAGILFNESDGSLTGVSSTDNHFGLVPPTSGGLAYSDGHNHFADNDQDVYEGGGMDDLAIADTPEGVPPSP